jgi:CheY-like chemotaxis protein
MDNLEQLIEKLKLIKLLYVEDNKEARESTYTLFQNIFDDITVAVDGKDALEKFHNGNFDLIVTDLSMPNMGGLEMIERIRNINKDISIIVLTALKDIKTVTKAIDIGVDCFINKPLEDMELLLSKFDSVLQKIEYDRVLKEKEQFKTDKEKIELILKFLKLIEHHWRQPLSIISAISSGMSISKDIGDEFTIEDFNHIDSITKTTIDMSNLLDSIKKIDFDNSSISDIEKIISISNEIITKEKNNV